MFLSSFAIVFMVVFSVSIALAVNNAFTLNFKSVRLFLVDMGATVSVFLHRSYESAADSLHIGGNQSIWSWGQCMLSPSLVDMPILGFFGQHQFDVSLACHLLV